MISPREFFSHLIWLDGRPLLDTIEPYRLDIFERAFALGAEDRRPINRVLSGRGKKNFKSADLDLAGAYSFFIPETVQGNDCAIIANTEKQADDDFDLLKKIIRKNPALSSEVVIKDKEIERTDGRGTFVILPARDVSGLHGKTFAFIGYDEIHGYKSYDVLEALAPDPTRDVLEWFTSYNTIFNRTGVPLYDLIQVGKSGSDPRMLFSWYAGDFTTDPAAQNLEPEAKANPSMASWGNAGYLAQQRRRLPSHKFRRLHLNLAGMPGGTFYDSERIEGCTVTGRRELKPQPGIEYRGFVDMSGGSNDDAACAASHFDAVTGKAVLDFVITQTGQPPFNPRAAVKKFAEKLKDYGISRVQGDRYAGETFRADFQDESISYELCPFTKHQIYEALEPLINAEEVELLDVSKMQEQLLGLVVRNQKIDHLSGEHDDMINAAAGALRLAAAQSVPVDVAGGSMVSGSGADGTNASMRQMEYEADRRDGIFELLTSNEEF